MSRAPSPHLFDMALRASRRDRAARLGPELFLLERAFDDCLERIALVERRFARALLVGCPHPAWPGRVPATKVDTVDPGPLFAAAAGGTVAVEDRWAGEAAAYDLVVAVGTLDTVNGLPLALSGLRAAMGDDALIIGAMSGGQTLPVLRAAMRAADATVGEAEPHIHPRVEAAKLAPLLGAAGFVNTVVDVDRARVSYRSIAPLLRDLRSMGATNVLADRPRRPLLKAAYAAAAQSFANHGNGECTVETFEILHFAAWTAASR